MATLSVVDAKRRFSELISRAAAGERFIIQRRLQPVAAVLGADELERLERRAQAAERLALALGQDNELLKRVETGEAHPAMAAFGLWATEDDLADLAEAIAGNRRRQRGRSVVSL
jgi:prevent-host-death family protein